VILKNQLSISLRITFDPWRQHRRFHLSFGLRSGSLMPVHESSFFMQPFGTFDKNGLLHRSTQDAWSLAIPVAEAILLSCAFMVAMLPKSIEQDGSFSIAHSPQEAVASTPWDGEHFSHSSVARHHVADGVVPDMPHVDLPDG
jgi:hypothetical protein